MVTGGDVQPGRGRGVVDEIAIVDRVRMLVQHQPGFGRSRHLGLFQKLGWAQTPGARFPANISKFDFINLPVSTDNLATVTPYGWCEFARGHL